VIDCCLTPRYYFFASDISRRKQVRFQ